MQWAVPALQAQAPASPPPSPPDRHAAIRHINLNDKGSVWIGFGGHVRERVESWTSFNFAALPPTPTTVKANDAFALSRLFASADLHVGNKVRLFAQGKSVLSTNRELAGGRRVIDVDELDVQQLYLDFRVAQAVPSGSSLTLRGGRLEMSHGRERLIHPLDWANTRRNYEGVSAVYAKRTTSVSAFWAQPMLVRLYKPDRRDSSTRQFGLYGTTRPRANIGADAYWIGLRRDAAAFNGTTGREARHTVGGRLWGPIRPQPTIDLEAESAIQFGEVGTGSIRAYMFTGQAGYTFRRVARTPRVYVNLDYASGDDATGGDVGTFNQINPTAHAFLGFADIAGRQNIVDLSGGGNIRVWRTLTAAADYHRFRRASSTDAFYAKNGTVSRAAGFGASKDIASEIDLTLRYPVDRHALLMTGWSHVFPGQFIKQGGSASGADRPIDFVYVTFQYTL